MRDYSVSRLRPFGATIFSEMTQLAQETGAINLGQGFPDEDGPAAMLTRAASEIASGNNQYGPGRGLPELRAAVARDRARRGHHLDPEREIIVTVGATEAIAAAVLGLVEPGQEVIVLEPYYDSYAAAIALAGARRVAVPLTLTEHDGWQPDAKAIRAAITARTAMLIVNSPHNPTGSVFTADALAQLRDIAVEHDLLVLADEVYEHLSSVPCTPIAILPGMRERTITASSAAKTFNATGWKTGWALGSPELLDAVLKAKQFLTFVGATPFQPAVAYALDGEQEWVAHLAAELKEKRESFSAVLREIGATVYPNTGTYYVVADVRPLGYRSGREFCLDLPHRAKVAAIPVEAFADGPGWESLVRFAVCKRPAVLAAAARQLRAVFTAR